MSNEISTLDSSRSVGASYDAEYKTIDLLRFWILLMRRKKLILAFAAGGLALGALLAFAIPPMYDGKVRFLPPPPKEASALSLLPTSRTNTGDRYLGLIGSRTVADDVIEHQHLREYFHAKNQTQARAQLAAMSTIITDKDNFVSVTVRAKEPQTAVNIANEYVSALYRLDNALNTAESQHRREFYEGPLEQEKNRLADAEEKLKLAEQKTGVLLPEAQARIGVGAIADLKQQITVLEAQLAALRMGGTEQNPQVVQLESRIASLQGQEARLEQQTGGHGTNDAGEQMPTLTLEVERQTRDVKFHETLFEILSRQYENARVEQAYTPAIELVDSAVMPDQKAWPPRKLFMLGGALLGGLLGVAYVLVAAFNLPSRLRQALSENEALMHADVSGR